MHEKARKIADLIKKYLYGSLDEEGARELDNWKSESIENQELFDRLTSNKLFETIQESSRWEKLIFSKIEKKIETEGKLRSMNWRWLVAASVVLLVALGSYLSFYRGESNKDAIADTSKTTSDVAPGSYSKAKLTLADGSVVILDSALGELAKQGSVTVKNEKGQLVYDAQGKNSELLYNTLSTSIGESYATVLSDNTKIWLNSGSTVTFPVAFSGNERVIEASGEIFLEVAKDTKRPFRVQVLQETGKKCEVEVLGTSFNVMAYSDELRIETTLLEGKIAFTSGNIKKSLVPGQQAALNSQGSIQVLDGVDKEKITAWKDQTFYFASDDLKTIVRQLSRWYGIEAVYEGTPSDRRFSGMVSRNKNLSEVLQMIEQSGIKFKIEGKKVIFKSE